MKRMLALFLTSLFAFTLAGCGREEPTVSAPAPTSALPASEQSETASQSETSRTWTEEEVLELYEADEKKTGKWQTA